MTHPKPPGRCHDNVRPLRERFGLRLHVQAANHHRILWHTQRLGVM